MIVKKVIRKVKAIPKRELGRMVNAAFRLLHFKVFGKLVFLNKYTKMLPPINFILKTMNERIVSGQIGVMNAVRDKEYRLWMVANYPDKNTLRLQKKRRFKHKPTISILVPTYNTNHQFLKKCIESVIDQTYSNWQLCIADDASSDKDVVDIIKSYAKKDSRIKYVKRAKNGHICKATNSALNMADGEFIALLDHDDMLWPNALYEVVDALNKDNALDFIYSDEDKVDESGDVHSGPFFKPDWSPEFLRSINYITHFAVIRRELVNKVGGFRSGYEGAQDWDLFLRVSRETDKIHHIPTVIYSWRMSDTSTAKNPSSKDYAYTNQHKVLEDDVKQRGMKAKVDWQIPLFMLRVKYELKKEAMVSIIIPTKDQYSFIEQCLRSIDEKTDYKNIEVIIVDTGSKDKRVWELYDKYKEKWSHLKIEKLNKKFNFAAVCDYGATFAKGEYLLFLNNDTQVISGSWVEDMLGYAQQDEIGAVGCKLYYPDGKLQHGGVILGVGGQDDTPGIAGHIFPAFRENPQQDPAQSLYDGGTRNFMAVTAACVMVSKDKFNEVNGFDPVFQIAFNDVDLCLKLHKKGYRSVYLPHVELFHHESISVGKPGEKKRDETVFAKEIQLMLKKWKPLIENDPYYHPDFRRDIASARLKL